MLRAGLVFFVLLAGVIYAASVIAQPGPTPPILDPFPDRPPIPSPGGPNDVIRHPRFKVELIHIKAVNEIGWDWTGSDKVFAISDTQITRIVTSKYPDVDSGDIVIIPPWETCIWPVPNPPGSTRWSCRPEGGAAPVIFAVTLWEADDESTYYGSGCTEGGPLVMPAGFWVPCIDSHDHLFSTRIFSYDEAELLARLPQPGAFFDLEGEASYVQHGLWWDWEYWLKIRVTRLGDVLEERPRPVIR